jgi:outer membrane protein assembly factor BamD (BamD/ComL family)
MTLAEILGGIIEEDLNRYPEQVATLYTERQAWNEAQSNGKEVLMTLFSTTSNALTLQDQLIHLIREKHHHRERNIVGALLWYHGLRSTEYFSRWIEAKNRSL